MCWLGEANAQSLQSAVRDLDVAYNNFFRKRARFPSFKSRHKHLPRFRCYQGSKVNFDNSTIQIVKHGRIKAAFDRRRWDGRIISVTISQNGRRQWFASILIENNDLVPVPPATVVDLRGVDLGLANMVVTSGPSRIKVAAEGLHRRELCRLRRAQRRVSRRKDGSYRKDRARRRVASIHGRVADRRQDFLHKLSRRLVDESQGLAFEDLDVKGMQKNRRLARAIGDAGWSELVRQCKYKCLWSGKHFVQIGRFDPSSKLCTCGRLNHTLKLGDREWVCSRCGVVHDRDELAADNIRRFALHPKNSLRAGSPEFTLAETV